MNLLHHLCEYHLLKYAELGEIASPVAKKGEASKVA